MLRDMLYSIGFENLLLGLVFVLILAIVLMGLSRFPRFQRSPAIKTVIGFCVSLLAIYGISRSRINLENIFYNLGFTEDFLYNVIIIAIIGFFVVSGYVRKTRKWRLYRPIIVLGFLFTVASLTPIIYEKGATLALSIPLLIIGMLLWWRRYKWRVKNDVEKQWSEKKIESYKQNLSRGEARRRARKQNF